MDLIGGTRWNHLGEAFLMNTCIITYRCRQANSQRRQQLFALPILLGATLKVFKKITSTEKQTEVTKIAPLVKALEMCIKCIPLCYIIN